MSVDFKNKAEESAGSIAAECQIFEMLKHPVSIIGKDGLIQYANRAYHEFFNTGSSDTRLDWEHPFFPEYRKRIAQSYMAALRGAEKRCFAIVNSPGGSHIPVEIHLFPMFTGAEVSSILALMIIVDDRLLSFDRSTLSIITEENFQYDNLHLEFSPMPIVRMSDDMQIIKCSHSLEGFIGYTAEEILNEKAVTFDTLFAQDAERIKKAAAGILSGENTFRRIGEAKITARDGEKKIANLTLYPIVDDKEITAVEIVMEDITKINELKNKVNAANRSPPLHRHHQGVPPHPQQHHQRDIEQDAAAPPDHGEGIGHRGHPDDGGIGPRDRRPGEAGPELHRQRPGDRTRTWSSRSSTSSRTGSSFRRCSSRSTISTTRSTSGLKKNIFPACTSTPTRASCARSSPRSS